MTGWSVMLRGIRYRSGRSLVVLLLAAFATATAVLAPAYGRAAQQSVLTDGLRAAPAAAAALTITAEGSADSSAAAHQPTGDSQAVVSAALARTPRLAAAVKPAISSVDTDALIAPDKAQQSRFAARLAWRQGACAHLRVAGECPIQADQVVLSERSATAAGVEVGDNITVRPAQGGTPGAKARQFEVVGLYTPLDPADGYWGNNGYFAQAAAGEGSAARLDAIFTGSEDDVQLGDAVPITLRLTYPLRTDAVHLDDVPALRAELGALGLALNASELQLETALLSIVDEAAKDQGALGRTVPIIAVPLLLLAFAVLFLLVAALIEERGPELALARLRGFPSGRAVRFGMGETMLLILLGAPLGLLAGLAAVELTARTVLADGSRVELRWPVFAAAAGGLLVACAAAWLAGRRTLARGVLGLLRRVPQRTTWRAGLLEGVALTLAVACIAAALQDRAAPLALLAPAALAVVAGIVAGRVLGLWARLRLRLARRSGRVPTMLAAAQLARRPGAARTVAVLTVSVALLAFAATAWDVAARARAQHADDAVGAPTVHLVAAEHPQALVEAVAKADPSGHAMAVVRTNEQYGQGTVELIGVQSERLSSVAIWRGHDRAAMSALATRLKGQAGPVAAVRGALSVRLDAGGLGVTPARFGAVLSAPGEPPTVLWLGQLRPGRHDYAGNAKGCANGCRLVGFAVGRVGSASGPVQATLKVQEVRAGGSAVALRSSDAAAWMLVADRTPNAKVRITAGERLSITIDSADQGDVLVSYLDTPARLPTVLAGAAPSSSDKTTFELPGLAGVQQRFIVLEKAPILPRVGAHGLLFDLDLAVRSAETTAGLADATDLRYEVWAGADAPADLATKLAGQGVRVLRTESVPDELAQLGRRAPALGLRLYLLAGVAAALLALGVLALSARLGATERRTELAALRITGVRAGTLRRSLRRERFALLGLPLLVGLLVGVAAAALMLPGIPLVTVGSTGLVGDVWNALTPRWAPDALPLAIAGALIVLLVAVARGGRPVRRATPDLIRGGNR